jgi:hypothetical protein
MLQSAQRAASAASAPAAVPRQQNRRKEDISKRKETFLLLPLPRLQLHARTLHPHPLPLVRARLPQSNHVRRGLRDLVLVQAPQAHQRRLRDDGLQRRGQDVGAVVRVAQLERQRRAVRGQRRAVADADDAELDVEALGDAL